VEIYNNKIKRRIKEVVGVMEEKKSKVFERVLFF
jgi:hypothetical protein